MNYISIAHNLLPLLIQLLLALAVLIRSKEIFALFETILSIFREVISGENKRASSRRVIALAASYVFFHLAIYCQYWDKNPNTTVMALLLVLIFLCLGLATLPQLMELWGSVRGVIFGAGVPAKGKEAEIKNDN